MKTLNDVVAGDVVIKTQGRHDSVCCVKRVTNTQIVLSFKNMAGGEYEQKFNKKHGDLVGETDTWYQTFVRVPADGQIEKIKLQTNLRAAIEHCQKYPWHKLPIEKLEQIKALLPIQEKD